MLEYGAGTVPSAWTTLAAATTPVNGGPLGTFDPSALPEGAYSLRLRVQGTAHTFADQSPSSSGT